jgi:hypothetical protein
MFKLKFYKAIFFSKQHTHNPNYTLRQSTGCLIFGYVSHSSLSRMFLSCVSKVMLFGLLVGSHGGMAHGTNLTWLKMLKARDRVSTFANASD